MTRFVFMLLLSAVVLLLELAISSFHLFIPLFACLIFTFSTAFSWKRVLVFAVLGGAVLDFMAGYAQPMSCVTLVLIGVFGMFWTRKIVHDSLLLHILPGAVIPLIFYFPRIFEHTSWAGLPFFAPSLFISSFFTALTLPFWILLFRSGARAADLEESPGAQSAAEEDSES